MNRKAYLSILAVVFLAISFLTGCSSSSSAPPVIGITGATPAATVTVTTAYGPLTAAVTSNGSPGGAGQAVIYTVQPGANGAGGTFAGGARRDSLPRISTPSRDQCSLTRVATSLAANKTITTVLGSSRLNPFPTQSHH